MAASNLTAARLRELLHYDPETGTFTWLKVPLKGWVKPGSIAGHLGAYGYWIIKINQRKYAASRLAWLYMTGEHPNNEVDHRDHDRANNKWGNLRAATRKQNQENKLTNPGSSSGHRGVTFDKLRGKWLARIKHHGHTKNLGRYTSMEEAIAARLSAERSTFTHSPACAPPSACPAASCPQDATLFPDPQCQ